MGTVRVTKKAYICFNIYKIFIINIRCNPLYHLSMTYITLYSLLFNSNCCILTAELNYRFTERWQFSEVQISPAIRLRLPLCGHFEPIITKGGGSRNAEGSFYSICWKMPNTILPPYHLVCFGVLISATQAISESNGAALHCLYRFFCFALL